MLAPMLSWIYVWSYFIALNTVGEWSEARFGVHLAGEVNIRHSFVCTLAPKARDNTQLLLWQATKGHVGLGLSLGRQPFLSPRQRSRR